MKKLIYLLLILLKCSSLNANLKVLHITFHKGCLNEIESISKELSLNLTSFYIPERLHFFDQQDQGNKLYNMSFERANRIWTKNKDFFESFDVVITSDTTPLARIFLQNNFKKYLIIWVCNRFDYYDGESLDCNFPDKEYYDLINKSYNKKNVKFIYYSKFEKYYTESKNIFLGDLIINPTGIRNDKKTEMQRINSETFYIPKYHNN